MEWVRQWGASCRCMAYDAPRQEYRSPSERGAHNAQLDALLKTPFGPDGRIRRRMRWPSTNTTALITRHRASAPSTLLYGVTACISSTAYGAAARPRSAVDAIRPLLDGPSRRERWYSIVVVLACTVLVPGMKRLTHSSCPWDLREFGGVAAYVPHWHWFALDGGPGHCFPSGHAVAAFAFLGGYFGWRRSRPGLARAWLVGVCVVGALFGWAQLARGAHYPSHTLWSAWLCWSLCVIINLLPRPTGGNAAPVAPVPRALGAD